MFHTFWLHFHHSMLTPTAEPLSTEKVSLMTSGFHMRQQETDLQRNTIALVCGVLYKEAWEEFTR